MLELHKADIIHGDYKPDNIMLTAIENFEQPFHRGKAQGVMLIDFGRAINNRVVAPHVPFRGRHYTSGFACPQMLTGQDWRFQVDLYGLAMCLHILMFGDYRKVQQILSTYR